MNTIPAPRFVLLQSSTNLTQFFYLVLMDLPSDTTKYPDPSSIIPVLNGTDLSYSTEDYVLPTDYTGPTITYLLTPYMAIVENEGLPDIKSITFNAKTSKKKGDTGGVLGKQLEDGVTPPYYVLKDRVYVIQSDTNTTTYFVGGLVDFPTTENTGTALHLKNVNELEVARVVSPNPSQTCLAYDQSRASYNPNTNPKTATYTALYVDGYNDGGLKGILLFEDVDLYANAIQPDYGHNVNTI